MPDRATTFLRRAYPEPNTGCWLFTGWETPFGYGLAHFNGKQQLAHRVSYQLFRSAIPDGLQVCHTCDVPCCVNPDHLFLGTQKDNIADRRKKGRARNGYTNATRCKRGHEFTPENTYTITRDGKERRDCRTCRASAYKRFVERRRSLA